MVEGEEPPASLVPSVAAATATTREEALDEVATARSVSASGVGSPDPKLFVEIGGPRWVPTVDGDGNEVPGIPSRRGGGAARHPSGLERAGVSGDRRRGPAHGHAGSSVPFAADEERRAAAGDPRPSIAARYGDRDGYLRAAGAAVDGLVAPSLMLEQDRARTCGPPRASSTTCSPARPNRRQDEWPGAEQQRAPRSLSTQPWIRRV